MAKRVVTAGKMTTDAAGRRVLVQSTELPDGKLFTVQDSRQHWEAAYAFGFLARCIRMRIQRTIPSR